MVGIPYSQGIAAIRRYALVVHGGIGSVVDVVVPLVQDKTEDGSPELLAQLGSEEHLVDGSGIEARHTGLDIQSIISLGLLVDVRQYGESASVCDSYTHCGCWHTYT